MKSSFGSMALALTAAAVTSAAPAILDDRAATISTTELSNIKFFAQYAATAYCNSNNTVGQPVACSGNSCPLVTANGAKTFKTFFSLLTDTDGLIAIDTVKSLIVVSFKGSHTVRNWITDFVFATTPTTLVSGGSIHLGFQTGWTEVSASVLSGVKAARAQYPNYKIVVTGHSLGGAIATVATANLRAAGIANVDMYTYGSPRVGNAAFVDFVSAQPGLEIRVTHLDDPVPRLPPIIFGYRHTSPEYWLSTGAATTVNYGTSDVKVCSGNANVGCNAGTLGLDVDAHNYYLGPIAGCSPSGFELRRRDGAAVSDAELEQRLNMFSALDVQFAGQLAAGTA